MFFRYKNVSLFIISGEFYELISVPNRIVY